MHPNTLRLFGYPIAAVVAGGLAWLGFGHQAEADFLTLLSSANIHAELAATIPANTDNQKGRELRERLIADADAWLARAEAVEPGTSACEQVRGFLANARGRPADAAAHYRRARGLSGVTPELIGALAMREAQSLSNAEDYAGALRVLAEPQAQAGGGDGNERDALRARILARAGQAAEARAVAEAILARSVDGSDGCRLAASLLEGLGAWPAAEAGWRKAETDGAVFGYHVARLKLRAGESEDAGVLLERSLADHDPEVVRRLTADKELWSAGLGSERIEQLLGSPTGQPAAAGR